MAEILVDKASVRFPVYLDSSVSIRRWFLERLIPGRQNRALPVAVDALTEISATFNDGDRVGLIGLNGAGKSTLLRLLAGIFEPSSGTISRSGRISTLFDLYLGMDDEASGYENVYIAGTILGLSRQEIRQLIPDVERFTELGDALLRALKTYSTGMRVRLAFAIATSTHSEILLIDEIIGVGDMRFLKRACQRIAERISNTKIMVLASHAEFVLLDFCTTGIVLDQGRIICHAPIADAIRFYNEHNA